MLILVFTENGSPFKLDRQDLINERKEYLDQDIQIYTDKLLTIWNKKHSFRDFTKMAIDLI